MRCMAPPGASLHIVEPPRWDELWAYLFVDHLVPSHWTDPGVCLSFKVIILWVGGEGIIGIELELSMLMYTYICMYICVYI